MVPVINYNSLEEAAENYFNKGFQLLQVKDYTGAIQLLRRAVNATRTTIKENDKDRDIASSSLYAANSKYSYYLALSLLRGSDPRKASQPTIQQVEEQLRASVSSHDINPTHLSRCYILWSIVKHGFYEMNGLSDKDPLPENPVTRMPSVFSEIPQVQRRDAIEIAYHISAPHNLYWEKINDYAGNQISQKRYIKRVGQLSQRKLDKSEG